MTFDDTKTISVVDWSGFGIAGDYGTTWFGGPGPYTPVRANLTTGARAALHRLEDRQRRWADLLAAVANPIDFGTAFSTASTRSRTTVSRASADRRPRDLQRVRLGHGGSRWNSSASAPSSTKWYGNAPIPWAATI